MPAPELARMHGNGLKRRVILEGLQVANQRYARVRAVVSDTPKPPSKQVTHAKLGTRISAWSTQRVEAQANLSQLGISSLESRRCSVLRGPGCGWSVQARRCFFKLADVERRRYPGRSACELFHKGDCVCERWIWRASGTLGVLYEPLHGDGASRGACRFEGHYCSRASLALWPRHQSKKLFLAQKRGFRVLIRNDSWNCLFFFFFF